MPPDQDVTIGELARRLAMMEQHVDSRLSSMITQIEQMNKLAVERNKIEVRALERRVSVVEDRLRWISRAIAAALITGAVSAVMTYVIVSGGAL